MPHFLNGKQKATKKMQRLSQSKERQASFIPCGKASTDWLGFHCWDTGAAGLRRQCCWGILLLAHNSLKSSATKMRRPPTWATTAPGGGGGVLSSLILNLLFTRGKSAINNFTCIIIPHKDYSTDVSRHSFYAECIRDFFHFIGFHFAVICTS